MNKRKILREAIVLLFAALMALPTSAVLTNTNTPTTTPQPASKGVVWDNVLGVHGSYGGVIVAMVRPDGIAYPADDFQFDAPQTVESIVWQGGYFQTQNASGDIDYNWDWRVLFWNDTGDGTHPGTIIYNETISNSSISRSLWYIYIRPDNGNHYWIANYSATLQDPFSFDANTKYWITIQAIGTYPPQSCWSRHNESVGGILLHQAVFKGDIWGYTDWTDIATLVPDHIPHDLNFQLLAAGGDTMPPVTTCTLEGEMSGANYTTPVKVTLTATDSESGVNYTKCKVDAGEWTTYNASFNITDEGTHTIGYYSVDNAGNIETEKDTTFTIHYPIQIIIKGGFGITATVTNVGDANMTNVSWSIALSGGLIFKGKSNSGTINALNIGMEVKIKDRPIIGFGKIAITVTAGGMTKGATGTVVLFLVLGVK